VNNREINIEDIVAKKLAGEITPAEETILAEWLENDPANRKHYNSLQQIFNVASLKPMEEVNTDAAWNKLKSKIDAGRTKEVKVIPLHQKWFIRIAAAVILIAGGAALTLYINSKNAGVEYAYSTFETAGEFKLPDSSTIYLNAKSKATVTITKKERKVKMEGEAFFNVVHNEHQPFIVEAGGLQITDIGTAFNVNASDSSKVDIIVEHGEVQISSGNEKLNAVKGEHVAYAHSTGSLTKLAITNPNDLSYITKIFVFENTSLPAVVQKLHEVYGTQIMLSDNLKFCRLTSTFKNEKIEYILQVIAETLQLRLNKNGDRFTLEGTGCQE
jgi:transmembrane sensor